MPQEALQTAGLDYLKGEQKVVIGAFRVAFAQKVSESARSSSLFNSASQSAAMSGTLQGLSPADYQAIADAAYADFVGKLRATGIDVIEPSGLGQSQAYASMAALASPLRMEGSNAGDVLMVAPTGVKLAVFPGEAGAASAFAGFDTSNPMRVIPVLVKEQNAGVMNVTYYIDFLNSASGGDTLVMGGDAEVSMGQALFSSEPYGTTRDITASGVNALGVVSGLLTGQGFGRKDLEIQADPARYRRIADQLLSQANTKLLDTVQQAR